MYQEGAWHEAKVTIDDEYWFDAYLQDARTQAQIDKGSPVFRSKTWNGHEMPCFTLEQGLEFANHFNAYPGNDTLVFHHNHPEHGRCFVAYEADNDVYDYYPAMECTLVDGTVAEMYPIGAGYWIWDGCLKDVSMYKLEEIQDE